MTLAPDELRDIIKGTVDGVLAFIDSECLPVEQRYREILTNEAKVFGNDGRLIPEIREARDEIRKKSANEVHSPTSRSSRSYAFLSRA